MEQPSKAIVRYRAKLLLLVAALAAAGIAGLLVGMAISKKLTVSIALGPAGPMSSATATWPRPTYETGGPPQGSSSGSQVSPAVTPLPTSTASSILDPTVTPSPAGAVFGLAWFHKPPGDGSSASEIATENLYIHLTGKSDIPFRNKLRAAGFTRPIYSYVSANGAEGPDPSTSKTECDYSRIPNDNNAAWQPDDFCTYINPHESWFLHNAKGERLADDYFGQGRWTYLMNPADPGWQSFSYERLLKIHDSWGYDGIWLDNLDLDLSRLTGGVTNSDGGVKEYSTNADWRQAMRQWLTGLREKVGDTPVWANLIGGGLEPDSWDAYAPYLNGAMDESFAVSWLDHWRSPEEWVSQVERAERWLASGKGLVMVGQGERSAGDRLLFTLASYLLVARGEGSFFRYTRFDSFYNTLWLYPEYQTARALGAPLGARKETSPGVWRRSFAHGYVEVNVTEHTGRLVLENQ